MWICSTGHAYPGVDKVAVTSTSSCRTPPALNVPGRPATGCPGVDSPEGIVAAERTVAIATPGKAAAGCPGVDRVTGIAVTVVTVAACADGAWIEG